MAKNLGVDLLFGIIDLIIEVADDSAKKSSGVLFSSMTRNTMRQNKANSINALAKLEEENFKRANPEPVYEPMTNKPVKTVSKADRMAAFAAIKSGKTSTRRETPKESTDISPQHSLNLISATAKQIKLEVMMLGYVFQEDDGKISGKEKKAIKKHYKTYLHKLTKEDLVDIKEMGGIDNSLINIRAFISQQDVSIDIINKSVRSTKEIIGNQNKYYDIIRRLETSLLESMGY